MSERKRPDPPDNAFWTVFILACVILAIAFAVSIVV